MEKLIITACICGAEVTKEQNPAVPYTVEEIAAEAKSAYDAGASIIHLHVREDDGTPTQSKERFQKCMEAIKAVCPDVIIQPSTCLLYTSIPVNCFSFRKQMCICRKKICQSLANICLCRLTDLLKYRKNRIN